MPINIGEIQAILTARDQMSPELVKAAERVQQLTNIFNALGDAAPDRVKQVERALAEAEIKFEQIRDSATKAAAAIEQVGPAADSSAARLQELQQKTAEAIAAFEAKKQAIKDAQIAEYNAAEATKAANITGTEQAAVLNAQTQAANATAAATERLVAAQQAAAAAAGQAPVPGSPLPPSSGTAPTTGQRASSVGAIAQDAAAANERLKELEGQAYINQIQRMSTAMIPLTQQQKEWMGLLKETGQLTIANAEKIGVNVIQYREWTEAVKGAGGAVKLTGDALMASLKGMSEPISREQALMLNQMREMRMLTLQNAEAIGVNEVQYKQFVAAMREGEAVAKANNQTFAQMGGLILRLVENMAVFYVLYKSGEAIADFFTYVQQLDNLNKTVGMSMGRLQEVAYTAQQTGSDFAKAGTYITHLQEVLGKMAPATGDALNQLNLNWSKIFAMNPDDKFNAIAKAISEIPDPLTRAKIEAQLFGTEAIDPLIMKLDQLSKQAPKIEDATVHATQSTIQLYKSLWSEVGPILASWIDRGQKVVEIMASPLFGGGPQTAKEAADNKSLIDGLISRVESGLALIPGMGAMPLVDALTKHGEGLNLNPNVVTPYTGPIYGPEQPKASPPTPHPLMGQEYIDSLRAQSQELKPLTAEQRAWLDQLERMNVLTLENAQHLDVTTVQFKEYQRQVQEAKKSLNEFNREQDKYNEAFTNLNSGGDTWRSTIEGIDGVVVELGKFYLTAHGQSAMSDMVKVFSQDYGLTESQVRAIGDAWKYDQTQMKEVATDTQTAMQDIVRWTGDAATYTAKVTQDNFAARRADADAWFDDELFKLNQLNISNETYFQAYNALLDAHHARVLAVNDAETDAYKKSMNELTVLWDQYYTDLSQQTGTAMDQQIAAAQKQADAARKAIRANDPLTDEKNVAIDAIYEQRVTNIIRSFDPLWTAWKDINEDMRHEWAQTWDDALQNADSFVEVLTKPLDDITSMFRRMIAGLLADWEQKLLGPMFDLTRQTLGQVFGVTNGTGSGTGGIGGVGGASGGNSRYVSQGIGGVASSIYAEYGDATGGNSGYISDSIHETEGTIYDFPGRRVTPAQRYGGGAVMAASGIYQLTRENNSTGQDVLGGIETGAGIGTMIMPGIGTAIGAGVGALAGYLKHVFQNREINDIAHDGGSKFGQVWSEDLIKTIKDNSKRFHDNVAGELYSIGSIIAENPVTTSNVDMYIARVHDIFSMIDQGHFSAADANKALDDSFEQLTAAATDSYGFISDSLKEIIDLNYRYGLQNEQVAKFEKDQVAAAVDGFNAIVIAQTDALTGWDKIKERVDNARKAIDDFRKAHPGEPIPIKLVTELSSAQAVQQAEAGRNREELGDIGHQAVGNVAAAMATGSSRIEAIAAESDSLTKLEQAYKDLGIEVDDEGLKALFMMNDQYKASKNLILGIDGVKKEIVSWQNLGIETADMFTRQERTGYAMYVRLQDQTARLGGTTKDALMPMQDYLHAAQEEAEKLGVPLDENTQRMIDQSKELGIWDDQAKRTKDATEKLADAIERLVKWLESIPSNVGTTVTTSFKVDGNSQVLLPGQGEQPEPEPGVGGGYKLDPDRYKNGNVLQPLFMESGGVVEADHLSGGGMGRVIQFRPAGGDVVPTMLSPGEGIVSPAGMGRIGRSGLDAINGGGSIGGDSSHDQYHFNINIHTQATNGHELAQAALEPGGLVDQMIAHIAGNKRKRGTKLKRGLEAA